MTLTDEELRKFMGYVQSNEKGCWIWLGPLDKDGYATFCLRKVMHQASRVSYEHFVGPLGSLFALHKCDIPACVNPEHLFKGTQKQNMQDAIRKGRHRNCFCRNLIARR